MPKRAAPSASTLTLWDVASNSEPTFDSLSTFCSFEQLSQSWCEDIFELTLESKRLMRYGNQPTDVVVVMRFQYGNLFNALSEMMSVKLQADEVQCALLSTFDVGLFHVDDAGRLAARYYATVDELNDDLFLAVDTNIREASSRRVVIVCQGASEGVDRSVYTISSKTRSPHLPLFGWSRELGCLVAVSKVYVGAAMRLDDVHEATAETQSEERDRARDEPDPTDVLEVSWPKLVFRMSAAEEAECKARILDQRHSRVEWLESGFLIETIETILVHSGCEDLDKTPSAATMRSLSVYWMRWLTQTKLLVIFVHPAKGRNSLMGVEMALADVKRIKLTREWLEDRKNAVVHICLPIATTRAAYDLPLRDKLEAAFKILFPDRDYAPSTTAHTRIAYTDILKRSVRGSPGRARRETNTVVQLNAVMHEPGHRCGRTDTPRYTRSRYGVPLFGARTSVGSVEKPASGEQRVAMRRSVTMQIWVDDVFYGNVMTCSVDDSRRTPSTTEESKKLLVGRELAWLSAKHCTLHPGRWCDETELASLHQLVQPAGAFVGRLSMKRFCLRLLREDCVWWVVYPLTMVVVDRDRQTVEYGHSAFPNEPLEQVYLKILRGAHERDALETNLDWRTLTGETGSRRPRDPVIAFKGLSGLAAAATYARNRGGAKTSHLLLAVELTPERVKAYDKQFDEMYWKCEQSVASELQRAREEHGGIVSEFHKDFRGVGPIDPDDPLAEYKKAFRSFEKFKKKKRDDEDIGRRAECKSGFPVYRDLGGFKSLADFASKTQTTSDSTTAVEAGASIPQKDNVHRNGRMFQHLDEGPFLLPHDLLFGVVFDDFWARDP